MGVMAGILGVGQLGAHTALANIHSFMHMVPLGTSFGSGSLIGSSLGQGKYNLAKNYAFISIYFACFTAASEIIILSLFYRNIFMLYTRNEEMLTLMKSVIYCLLLAEINSHLLGITKGIIKAMGRQSELAYYSFAINAIAANFFAISFGFVLEMGLPGVWLGLATAMSFGNAIFLYKICVADWLHETKKTLARVIRDKRNLALKESLHESLKSV